VGNLISVRHRGDRGLPDEVQPSRLIARVRGTPPGRVTLGRAGMLVNALAAGLAGVRSV